ncbi:MAG: hypothetical protein PHW93_06580 [Candidatus Methanomethylophilaceae archaeon]|nr:hypothetical protein [Candidatus Methanomethylophilaceae archaeon]
MAAIMIRRGLNLLTNQKEFLVKSIEERNTILDSEISAGDIAYVYDSDDVGNIYIVNEEKEWVIQ